LIVVTGTKRSGTSLWMQILVAAGLPAFGEATPKHWDGIREANPEGFYESTLRRGVNFETNPNPSTGFYVFPEQVTRHAVKIFTPGVARTERAYLGRVIGTMRHVREFEASVARMTAIEGDAARKLGRDPNKRPPQMTPWLEWWWQNYLLLRDASIRKYPLRMVTFGALIDDPSKVIGETLTWAGLGDAPVCADVVKCEHRHFVAAGVRHSEHVETFDELYDRTHRGIPLDEPFAQKLRETNDKLKPQIIEETRRTQVALDKLRAA